MTTSPDTTSMALFCDFENVALGVRDAKYEKFDIKRVLERLLLKGSIVVKKAYCDWERYKGFKATMHEANFELIEIPHVRQSGKNSADIRLVVDALDLCYTKSHVNTFVIISGDSDFSPLVSKLRENAKQVIGVGVKQSTSDLLIANCDEFIFYDDLVRDSERMQAKRAAREGQHQAANGRADAGQRRPDDERRQKNDVETRRTQAIELVLETVEALVAERGDSGKIRASVVKDALKRRQPHFSESYHGFRSFGGLLEEAQQRGLLDLERDDKSNVYVGRHAGPATAPGRFAPHAPAPQPSASVASNDEARATTAEPAPLPVTEEQAGRGRRGRGGREGAVAQRDEGDRGRSRHDTRRGNGRGAPAASDARADESAPADRQADEQHGKPPAAPRAPAPAEVLAELPLETAAGAEVSADDAAEALGTPAPAAKRPRAPRKTASRTPRKTTRRARPTEGE
jgi:uncharacterized LabA/DUF88 family protein